MERSHHPVSGFGGLGSATGTAPRDRDLPMLAVDGAIAAARRGATVLIGEGGPGWALAVRTTEDLGAAALERLASLEQASPMLVLTARRARSLRLTTGPGTGTVVVSWPEGVDPEAVQRLADPLAPSSSSRDTRGMRVSLGGNLHDASVKLMKLAGLIPAALVAELAPGAEPCARAAAGSAFARAADIDRYEDAASKGLRVVAEARVPLAEVEDARLVAFRPSAGTPEHLAIIVGAPDPRRPVLARLHSACLTGDLLGSLRCDCGDQLRGAIRFMSQAGGGVLLYLAQEGRGIGLVNKLRAYGLQDQGCDTIEANERLGFEADERLYSPAAEMLALLGYGSVRLMTNNPDKIRALQRHGIEVVERVPHAFAANDHNRSYLRTKALRTGHLLPVVTGAVADQAISEAWDGIAAPCYMEGESEDRVRKEGALRLAAPAAEDSKARVSSPARAGVARPTRNDAEAAVRTLVAWAGDDPDRPELARTPARVTAAYSELFAGYGIDPAAALRGSLMPDESEGRLVLLRDIRFVSFCEHHLLPFVGRVHVGYLPRRYLVGIGAVATAVDALARRLQIQERLTDQLASVLADVLDPRGLAVIVDATHQCASARGPRSDAHLVTSRQLGVLATDQGLASAFHALVAAPRIEASGAAT